MTGPIRVEVGDDVGAIRPEAPNILTLDMMEHVAGTPEEFDRGGDVRVAVVAGREDMFLVGSGVRAMREAWGLVNRVVPPAECVAEALRLAPELAAAPPIAARLATRAVLAAGDAPLTAGLSLERHRYELAMATDDRVEGVTALPEHRDPAWRGR